MKLLSKIEGWFWKCYDKRYHRSFPTPEAEITFYQERGDYALARFLAILHGYSEKAQELYVLELGKLVDEGHNEEAARLAEAEGYLRTAIKYYQKAGWQPAVQRLEEAIKSEDERKEFYRRAGLSDLYRGK